MYRVEQIRLPNDIVILNKLIKKDTNKTGVNLPIKLRSDESVICYKEYESNSIVSFIWFRIYSDNPVIADKYIWINFSYTLNKYRNQGLNKGLRIWIENFAQKNKIEKICSAPLDGSDSNIILIKLNYILDNITKKFFYKKINL